MYVLECFIRSDFKAYIPCIYGLIQKKNRNIQMTLYPYHTLTGTWAQKFLIYFHQHTEIKQLL